MGYSFQEKSLWVMLAGLLACFGCYFVLVLPGHGPQVQPHEVVLFILAVVGLTISQVIAHILLAIADRRTDPDERDQLIALKGERWGGYVLACGVFCALCAAVFVQGNFVFTHLLLGFWVAAQAVEYAAQLVHYRRGV